MSDRKPHYVDLAEGMLGGFAVAGGVVGWLLLAIWLESRLMMFGPIIGIFLWAAATVVLWRLRRPSP